MNVRIEFDSNEKSAYLSSLCPSKISAKAEDLVECDAASTCGSDSDSVVLFEHTRPQSSFVCGSSVIFRNLVPSVLADDISRAIESFGMDVMVNCPSFNMVDESVSGEVHEFNFGFSTIGLSSPDEAILLNFLIQSHGIDELLCRSKFARSDEDETTLVDSDEATDDEMMISGFSDIESLPDSGAAVSVEMFASAQENLSAEAAECILRDYLSAYGGIDSLVVSPRIEEFNQSLNCCFQAVCQLSAPAPLGPGFGSGQRVLLDGSRVEICVSLL